MWGISSAGRALAWHARGQRFDPAILHQKSTVLRRKYGAFLFTEASFWGLHCFACTVFRLFAGGSYTPLYTPQLLTLHHIQKGMFAARFFSRLLYHPLQCTAYNAPTTMQLSYYNVGEAFLQTPTVAWGNLWDCRAALRKLVSSVYLESDLSLPFGKNGKFLFQLGYTPVVSDMKKIFQKTAALSFPKWALAVWDMDTATLYMVKYDRSH